METIPPPPLLPPDPWATARAVCGWVFAFLFLAAQIRGCETADRVKRMEAGQREIRAELERIHTRLDDRERR